MLRQLFSVTPAVNAIDLSRPGTYVETAPEEVRIGLRGTPGRYILGFGLPAALGAALVFFWDSFPDVPLGTALLSATLAGLAGALIVNQTFDRRCFVLTERAIYLLKHPSVPSPAVTWELKMPPEMRVQKVLRLVSHTQSRERWISMYELQFRINGKWMAVAADLRPEKVVVLLQQLVSQFHFPVGRIEPPYMDQPLPDE